MKISKKMLFTSVDLLKYLKTVKKFSKVDEEILATVTYKYAYQKLENKDVLISFPYRENKELEINKRPLLMAEKIGEFIKKYANENSPIDSILVDPIDQRKSNIRPLQIKFLGKGRWSSLTTKKFVEFLKVKSLYEQNKITLIISIQGIFDINLEEIATWLRQNSFPFGEVVLIRPNGATGDTEFYQLKPSKNDRPKCLIISKKEILREF